MKNSRFLNKNNVIIALICLFSSLFFLLFFSRTTSPLYKPNGADSYTLILIGRELLRGNLPYVALTDNKGPLIWYLEAIAQIIIPGKTGVFVMQYIIMAFNLFLIIKIVNRVVYTSGIRGRWLNVFVSAFAIVSFLCSLVIWYEYGNLTEEYSIFFVIVALYVLCNKIIFSENSFSYYYMLIIGGCLGAIFMIRMNDCLSVFVICCIASYWASMHYNACWLKSLLYALIGFSCISFICTIQYLFCGKISDLVYDYLFVSKEFVQSVNNNFFGERINIILNSCVGVLNRRVCLFAIVLVIAYYAQNLVKNKGTIKVEKKITVWLLTIVLLPVCFFVSSLVKAREFLHYSMFMSISVSMISVVFLILIIDFINGFIKKHDYHGTIVKYEAFIMVLVMILLCNKSLYFLAQFKNTVAFYITVYNSKPEEKNYNEMMELASYIEDKNDVTGLGTAPEWYYITDTMTRYKYLFPLSLVKKSDSMRKKYDVFLMDNSPKWLVAYGSLNSLSSSMYEWEVEFIENNYSLISKNDYGELYHLR